MKETSTLERFMGIKIRLLAGGTGVSLVLMSTYQACQVIYIYVYIYDIQLLTSSFKAESKLA